MKTTTRDRGHPAGARDRARGRRPAQAAGRASRASGGRGRDEVLVLLGFSGRGDKDLAALERFADVEPWDARPVTVDELRALCLSLPGTHREGDLGRRRARGRRHVPGQGQDLRDHGPATAAARASGRRSSSRRTLLAAVPGRVSKSRAYVGRFGWVDVDFDGHRARPRSLREVIEGRLARGRPRRRCVAASSTAARRDEPTRRVATAAPGHERHRRRAPDRDGVRPGTRRGSRRAHPVRRRRLPGRRHELRDRAAPPIDAGADLLEVGPAVLGPARRRRDAPARVAGSRWRPARRSSARCALIERIAAARPDLPLVPMGYANQVIGGGDGRDRARALAGAGRGRA